MKPILFFLLLFLSTQLPAQNNQLVLRKNGKAIVRFQEGSTITIQTKLGLRYSGTIYLIQNDSIYFQDEGMRVQDIAVVYKSPKRKARLIPMRNEEFLFANLGIPLFATILTLGGQPFGSSLVFGATLVYGPILLYNLQRILLHGNRSYNIGSTYSLLVLDLYKSEKLPSKQ
ncbi:MAG: hypothetical protein K2X48_05440 [Chitinophagaceae bacterium]|nr:hypothetical protein [Chitinophagaceae bacterium]